MVITIIFFKFEVWFYNAVMHPKDENGMENSVDSDQTALLGAVCIWACTVSADA